jgi:hypothetical protein
MLQNKSKILFGEVQYHELLFGKNKHNL